MFKTGSESLFIWFMGKEKWKMLKRKEYGEQHSYIKRRGLGVSSKAENKVSLQREK